MFISQSVDLVLLTYAKPVSTSESQHLNHNVQYTGPQEVKKMNTYLYWYRGDMINYLHFLPLKICNIAK